MPGNTVAVQVVKEAALILPVPNLLFPTTDFKESVKSKVKKPWQSSLTNNLRTIKLAADVWSSSVILIGEKSPIRIDHTD